MLIDEESRAAILAAIADGVGVDGREDEGAAGDLLREIRSHRKSLIRQEQSAAMGEAALVEGGWDWETLGEQATLYLSVYGKDLEAAAVLIEAATRLDGPAGLAAAMRLLADMVSAFWDAGLYPAEDDEGVSSRFQPLSGLSGGGGDKDGALIAPLRRMALVAIGGDRLRHLDKVRADGLLAAAQTGSADQRKPRVEEAEEIYRSAEALAQRAPRRALNDAAAELEAAEEGWRQAIGFISERTKPQFPAASRVTDEIVAIRGWLQALLVKLPPDPAEALAAQMDAPETAADAAPSSAEGARLAERGGFVPGRIRTRDDALLAISAAAEYFLTCEPQSPFGATLREVDRRARLSLDEFLAELIPDESVRDVFYWRSGIKPPAAAGGET